MQMTRHTGHNFAFWFWKYFKKRVFFPNSFTNQSVFWHTGVKGHIQSYMQPEPYLKGIFTCFSLSSNAFSSSDARTIPLSVWFSCKGVGNALNGRRLKTHTKKYQQKERVCKETNSPPEQFLQWLPTGHLQMFSRSQGGFFSCYLVGTDCKENKTKQFCFHYPQLGCKQHNDIRILLSLFREVNPFVKTYYENSKISIYWKGWTASKWHISDLLLLTILISEQILRNGFEKTASFLSYTGGFHFLQALLRTIINREAWSTDMCLFLWTALLRPLAGPRTTTAESAHCCP